MKTIQFFALQIAVLLFSFTIQAQWTQMGESIDGEEAGDKCGTSVALSADGKVLALGVVENRSDDGFKSWSVGAGHVRVYDWKGSEWIQRGGNIVGEQDEEEAGVAVSLSADGNTLAIGASGNSQDLDDSKSDDALFNQGQVRIYVWDGTNWVQKGKDIDGFWISADFGSKTILSADGNVLAIEGHFNPDGYGYGHTAVYAWDGMAWKQRGDLFMGTGGGQGGQTISLSANGKVLAFPLSKQKEYAAQVYAWNGTTWEQKGKPFPVEEGDEDFVTLSLSADGNTFAMAVPTPWNQDTKRKQIKIFTWNGYDWGRKGGDLDYVNDHIGFGLQLSDDGNTFAVLGGTHQSFGSDHIKVYTFQDDIWIQKGEPIHQGPSETSFGSVISLSADGKIFAIGDPQNSEKGKYAGKVKVFHYEE